MTKMRLRGDVPKAAMERRLRWGKKILMRFMIDERAFDIQSDRVKSTGKKKGLDLTLSP